MTTRAPSRPEAEAGRAGTDAGLADPPDDDVPGGADRPGWRWPARRTVALHAGVLAGFLVVSLLMWWHVWITGHPTSTVTCQCGDVSEELFYVAWPAWAIAHGHNLFLSNAVFAGQGGINMLANTTWMAFGALFAPITWLLGPVATLNVGPLRGPVGSGRCRVLSL